MQALDKLREELKAIAARHEIKIFGIADLRGVKKNIEELYGTDLIHLDHAVVVALPYPIAVVNQLEDAPSHTYLHYYEVLNRRLDSVALSMALYLQDEGYEAFPVPASQRTKDRLSSIFSHRLAANQAGLGWVGKSSNFIHPVYGPRLRLVTVLTDAPIPADKPMENKCGKCSLCAEACPSGAITGHDFKEEDALENRFLAKNCDEHLIKVRSAFGKRVCGRCLAACPWGKNTHLKQV